MFDSAHSHGAWRPRKGSVRIARPSASLERTSNFYVDGVGWLHHGEFRDHDGIDGMFIGPPDVDWHVELTFHAAGTRPQPTDEDLVVLYLSAPQCNQIAERLDHLGHTVLKHPNPYWQSVAARCFRDPDGYVLVLCPTPLEQR